jgi:Spy/CpxP family protein refolding chaperone
MKKFGVIAMSAVVLFALSGMMLAEGAAPAGKDGRESRRVIGPKMVLAMASELNLTSDQMEKLKKISDETPAKATDKDEMKSNREALKAEMGKDSPDEAKIGAIIDKMSDSRKAAMKLRMHTALAVTAVLTKEQREILKKKMEEKKGAWGKRAGKSKYSGGK